MSTQPELLATETPMADHIQHFWNALAEKNVRILVDMRRDHEDGSFHWDSSSFGDDVAKALLQACRHAQGGRQCSCHPDDNPPVPCAQKYAYSECAANAPALLSGEPVAYRWRYPSRDQWHLQSYPPNPPCGADGIEVQKLYALPAPQCAPQPSGEPVAFLVDHYRPDFSIETEVAAEGDEGAYPVYRAVSCAAREADINYDELAKGSDPILRELAIIAMSEQTGSRWMMTAAEKGILEIIRLRAALPAAGGEASKREAVPLSKLADWFYDNGHEFVVSDDEDVAEALLNSFDIYPAASIPDERGGVS